MREPTTNDGVTPACRDSGGDDVPLVMLHGWGQTQEMFRHRFEGSRPARTSSARCSVPLLLDHCAQGWYVDTFLS